MTFYQNHDITINFNSVSFNYKGLIKKCLLTTVY